MIYHNKYTITLNRLSEMLETDNRKLLLRVKWLPVVITESRYGKFMAEYNEVFNNDDINYIVEQNIDRLNLKNKIEIYLPAIFTGLAFTPDKRFRKYYKEEFGVEYKDTGDLDRIVVKIKFLSKKLKESLYADTNRSKDQKGIAFEKIVNNIEIVLERSIDRNMKLYQFRFTYESAVEKSKAYEKMKRK